MENVHITFDFIDFQLCLLLHHLLFHLRPSPQNRHVVASLQNTRTSTALTSETYDGRRFREHPASHVHHLVCVDACSQLLRFGLYICDI